MRGLAVVQGARMRAAFLAAERKRAEEEATAARASAWRSRRVMHLALAVSAVGWFVVVVGVWAKVAGL